MIVPVLVRILIRTMIRRKNNDNISGTVEPSHCLQKKWVPLGTRSFRPSSRSQSGVSQGVLPGLSRGFRVQGRVLRFMGNHSWKHKL